MEDKERKLELMRLGIKKENSDFYIRYLSLMKSIENEWEVAKKLSCNGDISQILLEPFRKCYSESKEFREDVLEKLSKCDLEDSVIDDYFLNMGKHPYSQLHRKYPTLPEHDLDCLIDNGDIIILNKLREHLGYENAD